MMNHIASGTYSNYSTNRLTFPAPSLPPVWGQPDSNHLLQPTVSHEKSPPDPLRYQLPELVESVRQGWIYSSQAAAVVSVLFCGAETQLIAIIKGGSDNGHPGAFKLLLFLSYAAFILNASATIASLVMIDRLGDLPQRAAKLGSKAGHMLDDDMSCVDYPLEAHGAGGRWTWSRYHCLISLFAGSWCIFMQMAVYIWLFESRGLAIALSVLCAIGVSPWFSLLKEN